MRPVAIADTVDLSIGSLAVPVSTNYFDLKNLGWLIS